MPGDGSQPDLYQATFRVPAKLPPGTYRLVVSSAAGAGPAVTAYSTFAVAAAAHAVAAAAH